MMSFAWIILGFIAMLFVVVALWNAFNLIKAWVILLYAQYFIWKVNRLAKKYGWFEDIEK